MCLRLTLFHPISRFLSSLASWEGSNTGVIVAAAPSMGGYVRGNGQMAELLFGVETEYAIAELSAERDRESILLDLMERARQQLIQLPDLHPTGGIFLKTAPDFTSTAACIRRFARQNARTPGCGPLHPGRPQNLARLASSVEAEARREQKSCAFRCNVDYSGTPVDLGLP